MWEPVVGARGCRVGGGVPAHGRIGSGARGVDVLMPYYLRPILNHIPGQGPVSPQVWKIEGDTAVRVGISNPENGVATYFKANPGETIWQTMRRQSQLLV
jgi:hypothetical protein